QAPAVQLVLRHVAAGTHAVAEPGRNIPLVAELCRRLGGLPRYLEFAAERLRTVPVHRLLACGPTAEMLWSNDHALLAHQRSAVQSIRWDLGLLTPEHDRLLRRIAQLGGGGFVLDEVATGYDRTAPVEANPLALLSDLHEASLILADPQDRYRYRLAPFVAETLDRTLPGGGELDRWPSALAS
ncbi:MAG TPA: hypothetical protein VJT31_03970, partial [Rugosimonospora sp.]|nr:hypothetical protein [Rugosimonospora sp.]